MAGLLEYTVNFYNDEVSIVPDGKDIEEDLTTTRRPHKSIKLVTPGKYALMLDEHVVEYEEPEAKYPEAEEKKEATTKPAAPKPEKKAVEKPAAPQATHFY
jgi:hypothetical protein